MRSIIFVFLLAALISVAFSCDKFTKNQNLFCKFGKETKPCLQPNAASQAAACCAAKGGCNSVEFPKNKVCCFTQECLDRCYPGKGYKIGTVY